MKYKDFFYETYQGDRFKVTKRDIEPPEDEDVPEEDGEISVGSPRISDYLEEFENPCWDGYEMVGTKMKDGKEVPNCVPVNEMQVDESTAAEEITEYCKACLADYIREHTDTLTEAEYQGRKVSLGKPFRTSGGPKKFSVYVKNKKGNVVKVNFGDPNMRIKKNIPGRRKSFRARHSCDTAKDRTSARYWSCKAW